MPHATPVRLISFVLAALVVVGAWLAAEYGQRPAPAATARPRAAAGDAGDAQQRPPLAARDPAPGGTRLAPNTSVTFKCASGGRVSFGDQPCRGDERTLSVTAADNAPPTKPDNRLEQMRVSAAALEAARLARERQYDAELARRSAAAENSRSAKDLRCAQIDRAIAAVDAQLRAPHSASTGDYWNGERRKLYDERFSISC